MALWYVCQHDLVTIESTPKTTLFKNKVTLKHYSIRPTMYIIADNAPFTCFINICTVINLKLPKPSKYFLSIAS